jgi:phosphoglycolate phosphatase
VSFPFRAVIFDLDGTLIDSLADIAASMNHALSLHGFAPQPVPIYRMLVGEGLEYLAKNVLPLDQTRFVAQVVNDYRAHYADHCADRTAPYPGIPELLDALVKLEVRLAVLSNKRDDFTRRMVEKMFARWPFGEVRGSRAGIAQKPDPSGALEIARALELEPIDCAFVGDTAIDIRTSVAAGMFPVGVLWGFRDRAELEASGARALISHPLELLAVPG